MILQHKIKEAESQKERGSPRSELANDQDCDIVVSESKI